ncbi:MAG: ABC transporter permease [Desulfurococcales archaeon]|nr:ABC transporter permease [Desulfurococcales archaeon]
MDSLPSIVARSIIISGSATLIATAWSIPLAYHASTHRRLTPLVYAFEALVGIPTVLVGLLLYALLSRQGPLGWLGLLYTPQAIVIGEALLITPLLVAVSYRVLSEKSRELWELAATLGATSSQAARLVLSESLPGLTSSVIMGFSRAIGELGVALIVGGNIAGLTRTMTTSIALYTSMGEYDKAITLGLILLAITVTFSILARAVRREWE